MILIILLTKLVLKLYNLCIFLRKERYTIERYIKIRHIMSQLNSRILRGRYS